MGEHVKNNQGLHGAHRLFLLQLGITCGVATVLKLLLGNKEAVSAISGGLISIVPSMLFARMLFQHHGAKAARKIVNGFYKGEALKIVLSILMFAIVFNCFSIVPIVFFSMYILVQMIIWFAPIFFVNHQKQA